MGDFNKKKIVLGKKWVICGDFNDIKAHKNKKGGKKRLESSFADFRNFIAKMEMGDIKFRGESWTWTNNREGEGYIRDIG